MKRSVSFNAFMLYIMAFAKMAFPLITLPYLTRVLSVESYAVVSYVKAAMVYAQIFVDFGFILSATKDIALVDSDKEKISEIMSNVILSKIFLVLLGLIPLILACFFIDLLHSNVVYAMISYFGVALTILLPDFLFRGIQEMQSITIRFFIARSVSTILTFVLVKNDDCLLLVPIVDFVGTLVAVLWTWNKIKHMGYKIVAPKIIPSLHSLKKSFIYFLSSATTSIFGAFNTLLIGLILPLKEVSYWSVAMQLIAAVQSLYVPINSSLFPHMVKEKNLNLIWKVFAVIMPIVVGGSFFAYYISESVILLVAGDKYIGARDIFVALLPLLVISFPSTLFGWPCLGAINKEKQTTMTTVGAAVLQVLILLFYIVFDCFSLYTVALARIFSELLMLLSRLWLCLKYHSLFDKGLCHGR